MSALERYVWGELTEERRAEVLRRPALASDAAVRERVANIVARVRRDGDRALRELAESLDGVRLQSLEADEAELAEAEALLEPAQRDAIRAAAANIEAFHRAQAPAPLAVDTAPGVRCEKVTRPIRRVGLYVPAGTAPLPSTALMLGIPARLAGCPVRVLCTPPQQSGKADPAVLYAARVAGVQRVFKVGGAQAVAALAYGTATIPKVDKIFGPGSTWVTEAKAQVDRDPEGASRDFPAGPSEVMVLADDTANAAFVAADLLSQAEHGVDSQVLLVTTSPALAEAVAREVDAQLARLPRGAIAAQALEASCAILVDDLETGVEVANRYAPEHLILQVRDPRRWLERVDAAGSVFLGPWAPESVGDYCSGTNHVLPTYGYARRHSSLGLADFLRSMTVQELTPEGLKQIGPTAVTLAELEGLDAHARAVTTRLAALEAGGNA
ncbi:MAG TPA: histidinol dehydrogenase [Gammaproteobacteria bacterium]